VAWRLPVSFHAIGGPARRGRGPALARLATQPHEAQELLATLVLGGVLDRFPGLDVVLAEFDVGWIDHLVDRMDRLVDVHAGWAAASLERRPGESVASQVHVAVATDIGALRTLRRLPIERVLWGNDYPHAEGTWPRSAEAVARQTAGLPPGVVDAFTQDNAARLYRLALPSGVNLRPHHERGGT
jgi:predicted TIM-barrel fold metal-dependent hydrolase